MARTTPELVRGIITVEDDVDLTPFIDTANSLVTEVCAPIVTYDAARLELIERWLSAHFYAIFDQQLQAAKAGTVSVVYQTKIDYGFANTMYGQQALRLDTSGKLAGIDNTATTKRNITVSGFWAGIRPWERRYFGVWPTASTEN